MSAPTPTPNDLGVGARITVGVMDSDYVRLITEALAATDGTDLDVSSDDVSTLVRGTEQRVTEYLRDLLVPLARSGVHVNAHVMFSRGCPGEVECAVTPGVLRQTEVPALEQSGVQAVAQWSLYPLADDGGDHMREIYAAIDHAKGLGTFIGSEHYVTRLGGDLADVLATVAAGWVLTGHGVQHVTSHAVFSINSPTAKAGS